MGNRVGITGAAIFILSLSFFLFGIKRPPLYVFDEPLYIVGARSFLHGTENTNPEHPPLAKILIAGGMKLAGDNPLGWRLASAICGSLTLAAVFFWTYLLIPDYNLALTSAVLTLVNNFLFVIARVAMLDVFYFAFVMWGLVAFTAAIKLDVSILQRRILLLSSGLMFGIGTACKWNAVVSLAAGALVFGFLYLRDRYKVRQVGLPTLAVAFVILPIAAYCLAFWPLCHRFHQPFTARVLASMNVFIWRYHVNCPGNPGLDSRWYEWIFRSTPERGMSYLMGNFVVVWGGFLALLVCAWRFCKSPALPEGLLILLYALNLGQWIIIPQQRTVYYYYYPCAMFLSIGLAIVLDRIRNQRVLGVRPILIVIVMASAFFIYCYPRMAALEAPYDCALGCWV